MYLQTQKTEIQHARKITQATKPKMYHAIASIHNAARPRAIIVLCSPRSMKDTNNCTTAIKVISRDGQ